MSCTRTTLSCLSGLALVLSASACSGGDSSTAATTTTAPGAASSLGTTTPSLAAKSVPGTGTKIPVNQTITDPDFGDTFVVKNVVRGFPISDRFPAIKDSRELVLVELEITTGTKFSNVVGRSSFSVVTDNGTQNASSGSFEAEMTAAGYPTLVDVRTGKTGSGWAAFVVAPLNSKTLGLKYKRGAGKVIGSEQTIPAKDYDVPLVQ